MILSRDENWGEAFAFSYAGKLFLRRAGHFPAVGILLISMIRFIQDHVSASAQAGLALLGAVLLWSSSFIALKIAVSYYDPMVMVFGRMASSLLALGCLRVTLWRRTPIFQHGRVTRREWKYVVLLALCEPCFYFVFEGYAITLTTASQAGMVVAALPLAVVAAAWLVLGEKPGRRVWAGFLLAVAGVIWLSWGSEASESAPNPVLGNILETLAMLCGALYVICAKRLSANCSPVMITTVQSVIGFFFFLPLLTLPAVSLPEAFPLWPTLAVAFLGVCVTMLSFLLYNFAVRRVPASRTGAFLNLVPVLTLFMGLFFLDERLTLEQWAASALVLGGVVLSQWEPKSEKVSPVASDSVKEGETHAG